MSISNFAAEYKDEEQRFADRLSKQSEYWYQPPISLFRYLLSTAFYGFVVLPPMLLVWTALFAYDFNINLLLVELRNNLIATSPTISSDHNIIVSFWLLLGVLYSMIKIACVPWQSPNESKISEHMIEWHAKKIAMTIPDSTQDEHFFKKPIQPDEE